MTNFRNRVTLALATAIVTSLLGQGCSGSGGSHSSNPGQSSGQSSGQPQSCGHTECGAGQFCCNRSCGICAPEGGSCTQQVCEGTQG